MNATVPALPSVGNGRLYGSRRTRNAIVLTLSFTATAIGLGILALILGTLVFESFRACLGRCSPK